MEPSYCSFNLWQLLLLLPVAHAIVQRLPEMRVSNKEIVDLVKDLRETDVNRARSGQVELDFQGHTTTTDRTDRAARNLFKRVDPKLLQKPTYSKFISLLDNYEKVTGIPEMETRQERREIDAFVREVLSTQIWQRLYSFLKSKNHPFARSPNIFGNWIKHLWFGKYSRYRGVADTSGFEHVFLGEIKNGEISGMHSWIRFHLLEKDRPEAVDYRGFLIKRHDFMISLKFTWGTQEKRSGSFLVGTSPEFDLALFTLCFLSRRGRTTCDVEIDGCPVEITSYDMVQQGQVFIGTIYPTAGQFTDSCRNFPKNYSK